MLSGEVEIDETLIGGKLKASVGLNLRTAAAWRADPKNKQTVLAMVERGGRARAVVIPDRSGETLAAFIRANVSTDAVIYTDEFRLYSTLGREFAAHYTIHHGEKVYAQGHIHTQTVEGFFGNVRRGLSGVQHSVSRKWLQNYVNEFAFKYSHRDDGVPMFKLFLANVRKNAGPSPSSSQLPPALAS